jgi:Ca2+-binding EF-hand superfamily protein
MAAIGFPRELWEDSWRFGAPAQLSKGVDRVGFMRHLLGGVDQVDGRIADPRTEQGFCINLCLVSRLGQLASYLFDILDVNHNGCLEESEAKVYFRLSGYVTAELDYHYRQLLAAADSNHDGVITKVEFLRYMCADISVCADGSIDDGGLADALRFQIMCRGPAGTLIGTLFDLVDMDGSGYLDAAESQVYFQALGCDPAELDYYWADLRRVADTDRDGRISKAEFWKYLLSDMELDDAGCFADRTEERNIRAAINRLGKAGQMCGMLFDALDTDKSGVLEAAECREFLAMMGCDPEELDYYLADLLRVADRNHDGVIQKDEFLDYVLGDADLTNDGGYRDPDEEASIRKMVMLNGSAGKLTKALCDLVDADSSGYLEQPEGKVYLSLQGCDPEELDYYWNDLLRCADKNGDGRISKSEFVSYILGDAELAEDGSFSSAEQENQLKLSIACIGSAGRLVSSLFDAIDADGSGSLDEEEGKVFLTAVGAEEDELDYYWQDMLRCADSDQDGKISKKEFMEYTLGDIEVSDFGAFVDYEYERKIRYQARMLGPAGVKVRQLFKLIDQDGSDFLDENEGKQFLSAMGCEAAELDYYWADLLRTADTDRDGVISREEFFQYTMGDLDLDDAGGADEDFIRDLNQRIAALGSAGQKAGALFDLIDLDRSGYLEEREGLRFLDLCGFPHSQLQFAWEQVLETADRNEDGNIAKQEFLDYILMGHGVDERGQLIDRAFEQRLQQQIMLMGPAGQLLSMMFDTIDADSSGFMEQSEALVYLRSAGCADDELSYYWNDLLRCADRNGDGRISKNEFVTYILGDEELDAGGHFTDAERYSELAAQLSALGGPPVSPPPPGAMVIAEGVPPQRGAAGSLGDDDEPGVAQVVAAVLSALRRHGGSLAVAQPACLTLWNVAFADEDGSGLGALLEGGAVAAVAGAMRAHPRALGLQEAGCGMLWSLSHGSAEARRAVLTKPGDGLGALLAAMALPAASACLLEAACATIGNLALEPEQLLRASGSVETLTGMISSAMTRYPSSEAVQTVACKALSNLR